MKPFCTFFKGAEHDDIRGDGWEVISLKNMSSLEDVCTRGGSQVEVHGILRWERRHDCTS